jgi:hypothetical protein
VREYNLTISIAYTPNLIPIWNKAIISAREQLLTTRNVEQNCDGSSLATFPYIRKYPPLTMPLGGGPRRGVPIPPPASIPDYRPAKYSMLV